MLTETKSMTCIKSTKWNKTIKVKCFKYSKHTHTRKYLKWHALHLSAVKEINTASR